ncbi:diphthine synthase [Ceraceosorus bombacis]|uniref:diphthine methyl ester synthase n=1 Tax=Ceraceosorus bombacis TaxID=401625 RepID=A0A0P1BRE3_9BASI|nr:diphthine synthase [Ceraceosorus bombacis]
MVLYVIGLGLADEKDITLRGLEAIRSSSRVYLEAYTSILMLSDTSALEKLWGKSVILAHRETVELEADDIIRDCKDGNVSFCVVGDPLSATTHTDLILRAKASGATVRVVHNASIMTAIASSGLQPYNFGQTVSVPFAQVDSWLPRIAENLQHGMHTLVLGDIKVREQSEEDMARGIQRYQPPRYMLIPQLIEKLLSASEAHSQGLATSSLPVAPILNAQSTLAVALCRMGAESEGIFAGTLAELLALAAATPEEARAEEEMDDADELASEAELDKRRAQRAEERAHTAFGAPLHSLVIVGSRIHDMEARYAGQYKVKGSRWDDVAREVYGCRD